MRQTLLLALFVWTIAAPAVAQVINGETPLDETTLNRETPGPSEASASRPPDAARDKGAPSPNPDATSRARHE